MKEEIVEALTENFESHVQVFSKRLLQRVVFHQLSQTFRIFRLELMKAGKLGIAL